MEPVYFPHTYISDDAARFFSAIFGPVGVLLPADIDPPGIARFSSLAGEGAVSLEYPLKDATDRAALATALRDAHSAVNRGLTSDAALAMALTGRTPFYDDTNPGAIRDAVRAGGATMEKPDVSAELFLHSAQSLDFAQYEAALAMEEVRKKEAALFKKLNGEAPEAEGPAAFIDVPPQAAWHRVDQRLKFFGRMLAKAGISPAFLVTRSREAIEILMEAHGEALSPLLEQDVTLPPSQDEIRAARGLAKGLLKKGAEEAQELLPARSFGRPKQNPETRMMRLSFCVAEMNATALFAPLAGKPAPQDPTGRTLICLATGPDL